MLALREPKWRGKCSWTTVAHKRAHDRVIDHLGWRRENPNPIDRPCEKLKLIDPTKMSDSDDNGYAEPAQHALDLDEMLATAKKQIAHAWNSGRLKGIHQNTYAFGRLVIALRGDLEKTRKVWLEEHGEGVSDVAARKRRDRFRAAVSKFVDLPEPRTIVPLVTITQVTKHIRPSIDEPPWRAEMPREKKMIDGELLWVTRCPPARPVEPE